MASLISDLGSWTDGTWWLKEWPDEQEAGSKTRLLGWAWPTIFPSFMGGSGFGIPWQTAPVIVIFTLTTVRHQLIYLCVRLRTCHLVGVQWIFYEWNVNPGGKGDKDGKKKICCSEKNTGFKFQLQHYQCSQQDIEFNSNGSDEETWLLGFAEDVRTGRSIVPNLTKKIRQTSDKIMSFPSTPSLRSQGNQLTKSEERQTTEEKDKMWALAYLW